ncbi:MAG TPA: hypothetical protein VMQ76_03025 [Terracidiphilus sp.]|jgi:hypothetical protein|nr:hypothetical protein [Terracidiphilus sp.]
MAMKLIRLITTVASVLIGLAASAAPASRPWEEPAANLAGKIAEILGPGQARLTIRNLSTISNDEIPAIRRLLEQDLKAHGVLASGAESANQVRVTLSENQRERLWVAEMVEGNETRMAMVQVDHIIRSGPILNEQITLREQTTITTSELSSDEPILFAAEKDSLLLILQADSISVLNHTTEGWQKQSHQFFHFQRQLNRDPRGILIQSGGDPFSFSSFIPGLQCTTEPTRTDVPIQGTDSPWPLHCSESDDPWPLVQSGAANGSLKAFYNAASNYFTGVVSPSFGVELPPFYTAALLPRPSAGAALLIGGIDGKVQLAENGALKPVSGARDWGSDFATLHSGCGNGTQIVASGSGEAISDSLRAYELDAQEAVPASAPLAMNGTVTALWTAPDGKSIFAVVRKTANQGATNQYEVDRVTASCN